MKSNSITQQELENIHKAIKNIEDSFREIGMYEVKKNEAILVHRESINNLEQFKSEIREKYGDIHINLTNGEYTFDENKIDKDE